MEAISNVVPSSQRVMTSASPPLHRTNFGYDTWLPITRLHVSRRNPTGADRPGHPKPRHATRQRGAGAGESLQGCRLPVAAEHPARMSSASPAQETIRYRRRKSSSRPAAPAAPAAPPLKSLSPGATPDDAYWAAVDGEVRCPKTGTKLRNRNAPYRKNGLQWRHARAS
jgi:hypothetical protein